MLFRLASRNVLRHRMRTAMTLAAIIVGVVGIVLSGGFVQDIFVQLGEATIHSQTGHLQLQRAGYFESGSRFPEKYLIDNPEPLQKALLPIPEVADVMLRVSFSGLLNNGRGDWAVIGEGVEPDKEARLGTYLKVVAGRKLEDRDLQGVLVGQGVAQALRIAPGDRVILLVNTPEGALNSLELEVIGVFQTFSKDFDARAIRVSLTVAKELLFTSGVNSIVVRLKETATTDRVAQLVRRNVNAAEYDVLTWKELNDFYDKTVMLYKRQFGVLQLIILAMVLLSVANSVNMSVYERIGEYGTMMALGNSRGQIVSLVLTETGLLALIGSAAGVVLGVILAVLISAVGIPMPPPPNADLGYTASIRIVPAVAALAFAVGFVATSSAAVLPAFRVSRMRPVDALRANV